MAERNTVDPMSIDFGRKSGIHTGTVAAEIQAIQEREQKIDITPLLKEDVTGTSWTEKKKRSNKILSGDWDPKHSTI